MWAWTYAFIHLYIYIYTHALYVTSHIGAPARTAGVGATGLAELTAILNYLMAGNRKAVRE